MLIINTLNKEVLEKDLALLRDEVSGLPYIYLEEADIDDLFIIEESFGCVAFFSSKVFPIGIIYVTDEYFSMGQELRLSALLHEICHFLTHESCPFNDLSWDLNRSIERWISLPGEFLNLKYYREHYRKFFEVEVECRLEEFDWLVNELDSWISSGKFLDNLSLISMVLLAYIYYEVSGNKRFKKHFCLLKKAYDKVSKKRFPFNDYTNALKNSEFEVIRRIYEEWSEIPIPLNWSGSLSKEEIFSK